MVYIKQCPFCGGKGFLKQKERRELPGKYYIHVRCSVCGAQTWSYMCNDQAEAMSIKEQAVEAWNRRTSDQATEETNT